MSLHDILQELKEVRKDLQFYVKTVHSLRRENAELKKRVAELENLLVGKIPETPPTLPSWEKRKRRIKSAIPLVQRACLATAKRLGRPFRSQEVYDMFKSMFPVRPIAYKTIRRLCQIFVHEKFLVRTAPDTYWIHPKHYAY